MRFSAGCSIALSCLLLAACRGDDDKAAQAAEPAPAAVAEAAEPAEEAEESQGTTGRHRDQEDWVPAEYKSGRGKWRDPGVYIDGEVVGFLWFGELPAGLEPVWIEEEVDVEFTPKTGKRSVTEKQRRYRFAEYLQHLGVDLSKVKEVHIYGGKGKTMQVSGAKLRKFAKDFYFGFGGYTFGKPIPYVPPKMKLNSYLDRVTGVAVYIDKKPPKVVDGDGVRLGGEYVEGIPYFGEPLRGGVRVYKDDRLATIFKRRTLAEVANAEKSEEGVRWKLFDVLEQMDVKTDDIAEMWVINDERRVSRVAREQLEQMYFEAAPQSSGAILLSDGQVAQGLAFHTEPLPQQVAAMHEALLTADE